MSTSYIYGISSKAHNNKIVYVGKCLNRPLSGRIWQQFNDALKYNRKARLCVAIRKYGKDNFNYFVLEEMEGTNKELCLLEKKYIKLLNTHKDGYNMTKGGDGGKDTRNVAKYDNDGNLLETYSSVNEAATINNVFASNISMCANGGRCPRLNGYRYRYFDDVPLEHIEKYVHPLRGRKKIQSA